MRIGDADAEGIKLRVDRSKVCCAELARERRRDSSSRVEAGPGSWIAQYSSLGERWKATVRRRNSRRRGRNEPRTWDRKDRAFPSSVTSEPSERDCC